MAVNYIPPEKQTDYEGYSRFLELNPDIQEEKPPVAEVQARLRDFISQRLDPTHTSWKVDFFRTNRLPRVKRTGFTPLDDPAESQDTIDWLWYSY